MTVEAGSLYDAHKLRSTSLASVQVEISQHQIKRTVKRTDVSGVT